MRYVARHVVARPSTAFAGIPLVFVIARKEPAKTAIARQGARGRPQGKEVHRGAAMNARNAMQLKALINNKAKAAHVSPQLMLQNYMLERLIDRIQDLLGEIASS